MATILFFEKPGCRNNSRQKALLELAGHTVEAANLLEHPWTEKELEGFLGETPVAEWFNPFAPSVKSGETDPQAYERSDALTAMVRDPILIKRPLMQIGNLQLQGFDMARLRTIIDLTAVPGAETVVESLKMTDMGTCPHNGDPLPAQTRTIDP